MKSFEQVTGLTLKKPAQDPLLWQHLTDNNNINTIQALLGDAYKVQDFGIWHEKGDFGLGLSLQHKKGPITTDSLEALRDVLVPLLWTFTIVTLGDLACVISGREPSKFRAPS